MSRKFVLFAMLCIAGLVGSASRSSAAFTVDIKVGSQDSGPVVLTDTSPSFTYSSQGYTITVNGTENSGDLASPGIVDNSTIAVRRTTATTNRLVTITLTSTGFNLGGLNPLPVIVDNAMTVTKLVGDTGTPVTASGTTSIGPDGNPPTFTTSATTVSGNQTNSSVMHSGGPTTVGQPFTISNILVLNNLSVSNTSGSTDAQIELDSTVTAVPAPPALALLASGIPCALVYLRRRRKVA